MAIRTRADAYMQAARMEQVIINEIGGISPEALAALSRLERINILCLTRTLKTTLEHIDMVVQDAGFDDPEPL